MTVKIGKCTITCGDLTDWQELFAWTMPLGQLTQRYGRQMRSAALLSPLDAGNPNISSDSKPESPSR
jgi:hypothetical protein